MAPASLLGLLLLWKMELLIDMNFDFSKNMGRLIVLLMNFKPMSTIKFEYLMTKIPKFSVLIAEFIKEQFMTLSCRELSKRMAPSIL